MNNTTVKIDRPEWHEKSYHEQIWADNSVTVLICQRKTRDLIQLCLSSLLNHYPEINVLVVDGDSQDESLDWLRFMAAKHKNVKVWERIGINSHGEAMHEAIMQHISTKYVLLMDSDTLVRRHGFVEGMLQQFKENDNLYATGALMLVSRENQACGEPHHDKDVLRYAHPHCSLYSIPKYKELNVPFCNHGAPCVNNMIAAESNVMAVDTFPVDKYMQHLCGATWQDIPTIWYDDADINIRPLVTFICEKEIHFTELQKQTDHDFNIFPLGNHFEKLLATYEKRYEISNYIYDLRFKVNGEFICHLKEEMEIDANLVKEIRMNALFALQNDKKEFAVKGFNIIDRKHWQKHNTMAGK